MITSHHQNPARFQREQSRYSDQLQPIQPLRGWSHDLVDLALAALTVAFLWFLAGVLS
jgi:hypothetical protein